MQYRRVSLEEALKLRKGVNDFLDGIKRGVGAGSFDDVQPLANDHPSSDDFGKAIVWERVAEEGRPHIRILQGGDDHLIVEYGKMEGFDINYRCRCTALEKALRAPDAPAWLKKHLTNTVSGCATITLFYDGLRLPREKLIKHLQSLEDGIGNLTKIKVPCRRFKLPLSFESKEQDQATKRYMETTRPHAPYLPSNLDFVAKNNAFSPEKLKQNFLDGTFMAVIMGFFSGNTVSLPVDPRKRMSSPKCNPSRTVTPAGTAGLSCG